MQTLNKGVSYNNLQYVDCTNRFPVVEMLCSSRLEHALVKGSREQEIDWGKGLATNSGVIFKPFYLVTCFIVKVTSAWSIIE